MQPKILFTFVLGIALGAVLQSQRDRAAITEARQNEMQANGLEDECKSQLPDLKESAEGDYTLTLAANRKMVCEEQDVRITQQPDAVIPLVVECSHGVRP